jgi:2,4-dienoyl-CoA reductase-like NADH-dependent reductase (Old Yellow Enzyme family)
MGLLFTSATLGSLELKNRLVRSATAEKMADAEGRPRPMLGNLYRDLAEGGVGLIITGHMYVDPGGKCHPEMTGIDQEARVPELAELVDGVHEAGGRIAVQINHGGMRCSRETASDPMAPSAIEAEFLQRPARAMTVAEIERTVVAYGSAARRAKDAGFDAVQLHGAHGYLITQFLSPYVNRRQDDWGGDFERRLTFLRAVSGTVRKAVGPEFPVFIKLGVTDGIDGGLTPEMGRRVVAELAGMGLDGVEISCGIGGDAVTAIQPGIRTQEDEAYFREFARRSREVTSLPVMSVGGLRSREVMEDVLASGDADFISICRPLICEPDLPKRLELGQARASCISGNRCWASEPGVGIACKCPVEREPFPGS